MPVAAPPPSPSTAAPGRYRRPRAGVHPDRSLGWLRRLRPIIVVRRTEFAVAIGLGLLATLATVAVPVAVGGGIDALETDESPTPWVIALAALALCRFVLGYAYRFRLFRTAHTIENDLRNLIY